jgi:hypothetical protein
MSDRKSTSTWWRGLILSGVNGLLKIGFGSIPLIGPAAAKYSAKFRYRVTGMLGDKMFDGEKCPWCGGTIVKRPGKRGLFVGCSNYAKKGCRYTRNAY